MNCVSITSTGGDHADSAGVFARRRHRQRGGAGGQARDTRRRTRSLRGRRGTGAGRRRQRRVLLARNPAGLRSRSHADQSQHRPSLLPAAHRPQCGEALSRHGEHGAGVLRRPDQPRARADAQGAGRRVRVRCRRARDYAERERVAADSPERDRSRGRRRGRDDRAGLPADADHVGPADAARQDRRESRPVSGADDGRRSVRPHRKGHHAAHEGAPLLPHHESFGSVVSCAAASSMYSGKRFSTPTRGRSFRSRFASWSATRTA